MCATAAVGFALPTSVSVVISSLLVQVKRDREIKNILLSSNAYIHLEKLVKEKLLKSAGSKSYFIGTLGFWIMRESGLRTSG